MSNINDFVIENGVLKKYTGSDAKVIIPDSVTAIGDYAFKSYPADKTVKSIVVPESVKTIGIGVFENCTRLKKLVLPENISEIGEDAFKGIGGYSLFLGENIRISGAKQLFMSQDESWYSKRFDCAPIEMCFEGIIDKDAVAIKYFRSAIAKNKKKIFNQIISQSLTKRLVNFLEISNKISAKELDLYIEECRNGNKTELAAILLDYKNKHHTAESLAKAEKKKQDKALDVSEIKMSDWKAVFKISISDECATISGYKSKDKEVFIPEFVGEYKVTRIGKNAFKNCDIDSVVIPSGVTEIDNGAFLGCGVKSIELPETIVRIGRSAFDSSQISEIKLPESITVLEYGIFAGCENLKSINIHEGVTEIGQNAFAGCSSLKEVRLPSTIKRIKMFAFHECAELESLFVPENVELKDVTITMFCDKLTIYGVSGSSAEKYAGNAYQPFAIDESMRK